MLEHVSDRQLSTASAFNTPVSLIFISTLNRHHQVLSKEIIPYCVSSPTSSRRNTQIPTPVFLLLTIQLYKQSCVIVRTTVQLFCYQSLYRHDLWQHHNSWHCECFVPLDTRSCQGRVFQSLN